MKNTQVITFSTILIMLFILNVAFINKLNAQTTSSKLNSKPINKQTINFDDELVEGNAQKPEFFYLFQKKNFNYKRLIKLRENFIPEMHRNTEDIQRLKGGR